MRCLNEEGTLCELVEYDFLETRLQSLPITDDNVPPPSLNSSKYSTKIFPRRIQKTDAISFLAGKTPPLFHFEESPIANSLFHLFFGLERVAVYSCYIHSDETMTTSCKFHCNRLSNTSHDLIS